ncbi:hypothetical protein B484DRAFT_108828 [Ochromonadaceae sp. CCMP2298]|nr:hypothetical protein B484DRAFT_108828 [Ochromonadaceae sp. CCMP2298]
MCMYVCVCMCVCMCICVCVCMYEYMCAFLLRYATGTLFFYLFNTSLCVFNPHICVFNPYLSAYVCVCVFNPLPLYYNIYVTPFQCEHGCTKCPAAARTGRWSPGLAGPGVCWGPGGGHCACESESGWIAAGEYVCSTLICICIWLCIYPLSVYVYVFNPHLSVYMVYLILICKCLCCNPLLSIFVY